MAMQRTNDHNYTEMEYLHKSNQRETQSFSQLRIIKIFNIFLLKQIITANDKCFVKDLFFNDPKQLNVINETFNFRNNYYTFTNYKKKEKKKKIERTVFSRLERSRTK